MTVQLAAGMAVAALVGVSLVLGGDATVRQTCRSTLGAARLGVGGRAAAHLPDPWRRALAVRLVAAGVDPALGIPAAMGLQVASLGVGVAVVVGVGVSVGGRIGFVLGAVVGLLVIAAPELALRRRTLRRRTAMARDLPRILDLLVISVEAGLGLDQALGRVVRAVPGALADEFARLLVEVGAGVARSEALRGLASRCPVPELRSFALAMVQADAYGVSVGPLLRSQAEEVRTRHRQASQMLAQKAPVKLLVPMVLCIFPALLVVVAGPALLSVRSLLGP